MFKRFDHGPLALDIKLDSAIGKITHAAE